jgi:hypothetical protein
MEISVGNSIGISLTNELTYTAGPSFELKGSHVTWRTMSLNAATLTAEAAAITASNEAIAVQSKKTAVDNFLTAIGQQTLKADGTGTDAQVAMIKLIT